MVEHTQASRGGVPSTDLEEGMSTVTLESDPEEASSTTRRRERSRRRSSSTHEPSRVQTGGHGPSRLGPSLRERSRNDSSRGQTGGHGPSRREPSRHDLSSGQTGGHGPSVRGTSYREPSQHDISHGQTGGHGPSVREPSLREPSHHDSTRRQILSTQDNRQRRRTTLATAVEATVIRPTSRIRTSKAPLGDMSRTFVEGMVPPSEYQSEYPSSTGTSNTKVKGLVPASEYERERDARKTYPAHTSVSAFKSRAPSHVKSIFQSLEDKKYASRQTRIASMAPEERKRQETWAQSIIQRTGVCPQGFAWRRIQDGYHCEGEAHIMTDELIAEGKGGVLLVPNFQKDASFRWGPYYRGPDSDRYVYAGDPNVPCPEAFAEGRDGKLCWENIWRLLPDLTGMPERQEDLDRLNDELARVFGHRAIQVGAHLCPGMKYGPRSGTSGSNIMVNGRRISGLRPGSDFVYSSGQDSGRRGSRFRPGSSDARNEQHSERY